MACPLGINLASSDLMAIERLVMMIGKRDSDVVTRRQGGDGLG
jgi:hypothetical protein